MTKLNKIKGSKNMFEHLFLAHLFNENNKKLLTVTISVVETI